jgi:hypothetical protein
VGFLSRASPSPDPGSCLVSQAQDSEPENWWAFSHSMNSHKVPGSILKKYSKCKAVFYKYGRYNPINKWRLLCL